MRASGVELVGYSSLVVYRGKLVGTGQGHLEGPWRMILQEAYLLSGQASLLAQHSRHHHGRALLLRFSSWPLPNSHHGWTVGFHKSFNRLGQVVLKSGAAELSVREYVHPNLPLPFQRCQDYPVLHLPQLFGAGPAFLKPTTRFG